jgi:Peptidase M50B-like
MRKGGLSKSQKRLLLLSSFIVLAWFIPYLFWVTLPLQYLYTHLHEMGHALVAFATGGRGITIQVFADGSGVTRSYGGWQLLVSPAGYIGATVMGALVLALSATRDGARKALLGLLALMVFGLVFWIRGDVVGILSALLVIGGFGVLLRSKTLPIQEIVQFLGLFLCVTSLQAVLQILKIGQVVIAGNDAEILQEATHIPAIVSAILWSGVSFAVAWWGLRRAWSAR